MILAFLMLFLFFDSTYAEDGFHALIEASAAGTLYLFCMTEFLSLFAGLTGNRVRAAWLFLALLLFLLLLYRGKKGKALAVREYFSRKNVKIRMKSGKAFLMPEGWILCLTGVGVLILSLCTVPYNWDSMTYHLPRILHWAQNGSVAHYASNSVRQLGSPVLAEYVNLQVYLLYGRTDRCFGLLQAVSYVLSAAMVYGLSRRLGGGKKMAFLAAFLYMSMPIAFAEALTTQVDNYATLWLLYFAYLLLDFLDLDKKLVFDREVCFRVCLLGLLVSFGYLTKPSVCVAMVVLVLWLLLRCIARRDNPLVILKLILCVLPVIILPILPGLVRNFRTFAAMAPSMVGQRQLVGTMHPGYVFLNFVKNFTYNMPVPFWKGSGLFLTRAAAYLARLLGLNLDDERISEGGQEFVMHAAPEYEHDTAINPLILYLLLFCVLSLLAVLVRGKKERQESPVWKEYFRAALLSFLLFCAILRWEPYVTRYMAAYLALLCPALALALQNTLGEKVRTGVFLAVCLCGLADLAGLSRFHIGICRQYQGTERIKGYFASRTTEYEPYLEICQMIRDRNCRQIGLSMKENHYEYPFWVMLKEDMDRLEHVAVKNESAKYSDTDFVPDCIIRLGKKPKSALEVNGVKYGEIYCMEEGYYLLFPEEQGQN